MKKYCVALALLLVPSVALAGGWLKDIGDKLGRGIVSEATGIDVTKHEENNSNNEDQAASSGTLPRGAITTACGCYGSVPVGATRVNQACASGVEQIMLCNGRCPGRVRPSATVCQ